MKIVGEARHVSSVQFGHHLTEVPLGSGLPDPEDLQDELLGYCDVLLGRAEPPIHSPYLDLCEIASAYYARAAELDILIHKAEQDREIPRGHILQKMRTGQIRTFMEMARKMADLGSRRLTQEDLIQRQRYDAGERF